MPPQSTPLKFKESGRVRFSATTPTAEEKQKILRSEMDGYFLGPMPAQAFMDDFMPRPMSGTPPSIDFASVMDPIRTKDTHESAMYGPLIKLITDSNVCPSLVLKNTSAYVDLEGEQLKPDISFYHVDSTFAKKYPGIKCAPSWKEMELFAEVKKEGEDPFQDTPLPHPMDIFENPFSRGPRSRGQIISYATTLSSRQHRTFFFSICIIGRFVRFMRWDRSGCIVTQRFDFYENPRNFVEFLWRYDHLSREGRGYDPSVTLASSDQCEVFRRALKKYPHLYSVSFNVSDWDVYRFKVEDDNGGRYFIANKPVSRADSPIGRATRGYVALDELTENLVFLKDSWRVDMPRMIPESTTYKVLAQRNVPYVAPFLCGNDVLWPDRPHGTPLSLSGNCSTIRCFDSDSCGNSDDEKDDVYLTPECSDIDEPANGSTKLPELVFPPHWNAQTTISQDYTDSDRFPWLLPNQREEFKRHVHFRMVQDMIAKPLDEFSNSQELVRALYHALLALKSAWDAGICHRDISSGNVLITPGGDGMLNDWDLSRFVDDLRNGARQHDRTGTWQFLSIALLKDMSKVHEISDEIEAVFWVLMYEALHYARHPFLPKMDMELLFDSAKAFGEEIIGGTGKLGMITWFDYIENLKFDCDPLNDLIYQLIELFGSFYFNKRRNPVLGSRTKARSKNVLDSFDYVIGLFKEALESPSWVDDRAVGDQYPRKPKGWLLELPQKRGSEGPHGGRAAKRRKAQSAQ